MTEKLNSEYQMSSSSKNLFRNDATSQQGMLCEIEYSIESLKLKMLERLDAIKESSIKHIHDSDKKTRESGAVDFFNIEAFQAFERSLNTEISSLRYELSNTGKHSGCAGKLMSCQTKATRASKDARHTFTYTQVQLPQEPSR